MGSTKNFLKNYKIIDAQSMGADVTSSVTNIQVIDNVGIQISFTTSDAVGTFYVQISADYDAHLGTGTWINLDLSSTPTAASANADYYLDLNQLSAPWIRLFYDRTSGTGTLNAYITGKMV